MKRAQRKIYMLIGLSIAFLACSRDNGEWAEFDEKNQISFTTDISATRGLPILHVGDGTNLDGFKRLGRTFEVTSYIHKADGSYSIDAGSANRGNTITGNVLVNDRFIWEHEIPMYWPNESNLFNFCAYSPKAYSQLTDIKLTPTGDISLMYNTDAVVQKTVPYEMHRHEFKRSDGTVVSRTSIQDANGILKGMQEDLMYAITSRHVSPSLMHNQSPVPLAFKHILTQIHFEAVAEQHLKVIIKAMTLHNIKSKGTFAVSEVSTLNRKQITTGKWTTTEETRPNYHNVSVEWGRTLSIENYPKEITSIYDPNKPTYGKQNVENTLMLIPQSFKEWNRAVSIEANDSETGDKGGYLKIYCDIYLQDIGDHTSELLIFGDDVKVIDSQPLTPLDQHCIFVPISSQNNAGDVFWKPGEKVTYRLTFGVKYDNEGNPTLESLTDVGTDVVVKPWTDEDVFIDEPETGSGEDMIEEDITI